MIQDSTNITILIVVFLLCFTFLAAYFGHLIIHTQVWKVRRLLKLIARQRKTIVELKQDQKILLDEWLKDFSEREDKYNAILDKIEEITSKQ